MFKIICNIIITNYEVPSNRFSYKILIMCCFYAITLLYSFQLHTCCYIIYLQYITITYITTLEERSTKKKLQIIDHLLGIVPIRFLSFCWLFVYGRKYAIEKMQVPVVKMQVQGSDNANPWTNIFLLELMVQRLKCCPHFDHDLSVTCPWLVQKLFVTCSWIIHNLFTTCLWLIHDCPWLDYVLFTTC